MNDAVEFLYTVAVDVGVDSADLARLIVEASEVRAEGDSIAALAADRGRAGTAGGPTAEYT